MSHAVVSAITLVTRGQDFFVYMKAADSNIYPQDQKSGFLLRKFENEAAAKAYLFIQRMSGNLNFDFSLDQIKTLPVEVSSGMKETLEKFENKNPSLEVLTVSQAIKDIELDCCDRGQYFYGIEELLLAEDAVKALRSGIPVPNPVAPEYLVDRAIKSCPVTYSSGQYGFNDKVKEMLVENPVLALEVGPFGITPLIRLAGVGAFEKEMIDGVDQSVQLLLDNGANPNAVNSLEKNALHIHAASYYFNAHLVQMLLSKGIDIDAKDCDGNTALQIAVSYKREKTCKFLLESNSDIENLNKYGQSALDIAKISGVEIIVEMIVNAVGLREIEEPQERMTG